MELEAQGRASVASNSLWHESIHKTSYEACFWVLLKASYLVSSSGNILWGIQYDFNKTVSVYISQSWFLLFANKTLNNTLPLLNGWFERLLAFTAWATACCPWVHSRPAPTCQIPYCFSNVHQACAYLALPLHWEATHRCAEGTQFCCIA